MLLKEIYRQIVLHRWNLAFLDNTVEEIVLGKELRYRYVKHPYKNRWFADPFVLDYDNESIVLFVEDYADVDKKGKISKLVIDRKTMEVTDAKIILELDSHLSFPAIVRKEGRVFIYPENSQANTLDLYEYDRETDECRKVCQLSNESMADAVISEHFGGKYLFSTKGNGNVLDVYGKDEKTGLYVFNSNVAFGENIARNGGDFFEYKGSLYRAAQECNYMYGHALSIQRIEKTNSGFAVDEVRRIAPPSGAIGIHTMNTYKGLTVVDLKVFRHHWIAAPLFSVRNWFKR